MTLPLLALAEQPAERITHFPGSDYDRALDGPRLVRQHARISALMLDGQWRTLSEIAAQTGDHEASISAQLRHLRKPKFGGYVVEKQRRGLETRGLWEYRVTKKAVDSQSPRL